MSGFTRVSIPPSLRKTIQDIKEITGKHSDEDVYAMLKECNMDPNETAQKLLYLDSFHEVKRKRDRRKVSANNRMPGMQRQGNRAGNFYSDHSNETVGGKPVNGHKQNGYNNPMGRASKSFVAASQNGRNIAPSFASSTATADDLLSCCNEISSQESTSHPAECDMRNILKDAEHEYGQKKISLRPLNFKQRSMLYPGPTPTSTPTNPSDIAKAARSQGGSLRRSSSRFADSADLSSISSAYSSQSDPVLDQALNPQISSSGGAVKSETENRQNSSEISANLLAKSRMNALACDKSSSEHRGDERIQEFSPLPPSSSHNIVVDKGNNETCSLQQVNTSPEASDIAPEANSYSHPTMDVPSEKAASEVNANKLDKPNKQSVIFPNHLCVPEDLKKTLTFGSLDVPVLLDENFKPRDVSVPSNVEAAKEPSSSLKPSSPACGPDHGQSLAQMMLNLSPSQNESSGSTLKYDLSKQEMLQPVGRPHNPLLPPMSEHGPNLASPGVGSHAVKLEGYEPQGGKNSQIPPKTGTTPPMAQPRGIAQSSLAVSPPLFPLLRQPYPPNYIPYNPYFSQLYMHSQNAHHLLSHSGFPQQPSSGNIFMPPTATTTSSIKYPIYKPGNMARSMTHFGISSGYGPLGAPGLGYGTGNTLHPGMVSNNDIAGSELKEKDMYSTLKQNEDLHVPNPMPGEDMSAAFQANIFYNLPQGQPVAFPHAAPVGNNSFPSVYRHPSPSSISSSSQLQPANTAVELRIPPQLNTSSAADTDPSGIAAPVSAQIRADQLEPETVEQRQDADMRY